MIITILFTIITPIAVYINVVQPMLDAREQAKEDAIYDSKLFDVEVTDKSNIANLLGYNVSNFKFKITNNSTKDIVGLYGIMTVKNANNNEQLFRGNVELTGFLKADNSSTWNVQVERAENIPVWDTEYDDMNIYFRITEIDFNQGGFKRYNNQDVLIKRATSSSSGNQGSGNNGNTGNTDTNQWEGVDIARVFGLELNNDNVSYEITEYNGDATEITLPQSYNNYPITSISTMAFRHNSNIEKIVIPDNFVCIGAYAFQNCYSLTEVIISSTVSSIGNQAFEQCTQLATIKVYPNNTVYTSQDNLGNEINGIIDVDSNSLIYGCMNTIIPNTVTSIGNYAFSNCRNLSSITIPNSVESIGDYAFYYCTGLSSITLPYSITYIGDYAFCECSALTEITIPHNVISIGNYVFFYCENLTSINIEVAVDIVSRTISGLHTIGSGAFRYCTSLKSITIPTTVESIGDWAFANCSKLRLVTIQLQHWDDWSGYPESVSIGGYAFSNCISLSSIVIPSSVKSIDNDAFDDCINLITIYCEADSKPSGWSSSWKSGCDATEVWGYKG